MDEKEGLRFAVDRMAGPEGIESYKLPSVRAKGDASFDPDRLSLESYTELADANFAINFMRARAHMERTAARAEKTGLGIKEIAELTGSLLQRFAGPLVAPTDSAEAQSKESPTAG